MIPNLKHTASRLRALWSNKGGPEYARVIADVYWRSLLCLAILVVAGAGIYAATFFLSVLPQTGAGPSLGSGSATSASNEDKVQAVVNALSARASAYQSLQANPPSGAPDPDSGD